MITVAELSWLSLGSFLPERNLSNATTVKKIQVCLSLELLIFLSTYLQIVEEKLADIPELNCGLVC